MRSRLSSAWVCAAALVAVALFSAVWVGSAWAEPATATAGLAPHVPITYDTDVCAMCHRTHSAPGDATWRDSLNQTRTALVAGSPGSGDAGLCYTCHGVETLGSGTDIQSSFDATSGHSLEPIPSAFGVSPKNCSTCHDSHGAARVSTGVPYPALLRARTASGALVYSGDVVCTGCHGVRAASSFPGQSVWAASPHSRIATPASGTRIVCSACHDPHGSPIAPSIRTALATPSAPGTYAVAANDRRLCFGCHSATLGVWNGSAAYPGSSHASSTATVTISGEWVTGTVVPFRAVGECQVCHASMGKGDASGTIIPTLLNAKGRVLCDTCHRTGGPAASNLASLAYSPTTPGNEIVAAWGAVTSDRYGRAQVFAREATSTTTPVGPRDLYPVTKVGDMAAGDIDGNGVAEAVVSDLSAARVAILTQSDLRSVVATLVTLPGAAPADKLSVGDVFIDGSGLPELVSVTSTGTVRVSRYVAGSLVSVDSVVVTGTPLAVASGNVTGTAGADVVVTTVANTMFIITDSGGTLVSYGPYATRTNPVSVSVGNADSDTSTAEIAVGNAGEVNNIVSLYRGTGVRYDDGGGPLPAGASVTAVLMADILPGVTPGGTSGAEIAVAYANAGNRTGLLIVPQPLSTSTTQLYPAADRSNARALGFGDTDGDGDRDLVVALSGAFTRDASATPPSIAIYTPVSPGGATLTLQHTAWGAGAEMVSSRAAIAVADMGAVVPSRHPAGVVAGAHAPTETPPYTRHVECVDCHNVHEAKSDSADTTLMAGEELGAWGISRAALSSATPVRARATAEYEVCYACHSSADPSANRNVASEVVTSGMSYHPIEGRSPNTSATGSTLTTAVVAGDRIRCTSCHGNAGTGVAGPHRSPAWPLLYKRFSGTVAVDSQMVCYGCHASGVYLTGANDGVGGTRSGFYNTAAGVGKPEQRKLHSYHATAGVACAACHLSHGAPTRRAMLRGDAFTWTELAGGGQCDVACHTPSTTHSYTR